MTEEIVGLVDDLYEMRLESLLSVQDLVQAVVAALEVRCVSFRLLAQSCNSQVTFIEYIAIQKKRYTCSYWYLLNDAILHM